MYYIYKSKGNTSGNKVGAHGHDKAITGMVTGVTKTVTSSKGGLCVSHGRERKGKTN